jgi:hypothetical protein
MDYIYVVPSYNRVAIFKKKTLAFLQKHKVPKEAIYLFVANEEQATAYKDCEVGHIVVGMIGLVAVRNYIHSYFPVGQRMVCFDDDVDDLVELADNGKTKPLEDLHSLITNGFDLCQKNGARLWGAYPTPNAFFMKPKISTDLKFVIGSFWGCINPGSGFTIPYGTGQKEDYQRTILFWEADGCIVRFNNVAVKTGTYKTPGGLNTSNRGDLERTTVASMLERWPTYIYLNTRRKSPYPELLLKRSAKK